MYKFYTVKLDITFYKWPDNQQGLRFQLHFKKDTLILLAYFEMAHLQSAVKAFEWKYTASSTELVPTIITVNFSDNVFKAMSVDLCVKSLLE